MTPQIPKPADKAFLGRIVDATIHIGLLLALIASCFQIVRPFLVPVVWGVIIAIAAYPLYRRLERALGGRRGLAATLFSVLALVIILGPTVMLAETLAGGASAVATRVGEGRLAIPPPPEDVASWPLVGERLHTLWSLATHNLGEALEPFKPQIREAGGWLLSTAAGAGFGVLQFVFAIILAGVFLARAEGSGRAANAIAFRLAGEHGPEYAALAMDTVRSVSRGILGVALIQAILAGLGFLVAGIPGAGLLALACLILAVIQVGVGPVVIPVAIYVFYTSDTVSAVLFLVWGVLVMGSDNVLKPILLGRGVKAPMLVVFLGAIGGFLYLGIIGLFIGPVVLALGYTLFVAWLRKAPVSPADRQPPPPAGTAADGGGP